MKTEGTETLTTNKKRVDPDSEILRLKRELGFRTSLSEVLTTYKSPEDLFPELLKVLCDGFRAEGGAIYFKDKYSDRITLKNTIGFSQEYSKRYSEIVMGEHLTGKSAQRREPILVTDSNADPRSTDGVIKILEYRSALVTPVLAGEELVGVIALIHRKPDSFDERDLEFLESISGNLSLAIVNSYLHRDILEEKAKVFSIIEGSREGVFEALVPPEERFELEKDMSGFGKLAHFTLLNSVFRDQIDRKVKEGSPMEDGFESSYLRSFIDKVIQNGYFQGIERIRKKDAKKVYELNLFSIQDDRGVFGIRGIRRDITPNMLMQRKLRNSKRRMELYLDLLSHDVSNINTVSLGFLQLLMDRGVMDEESCRYLQECMVALKRSSDLVSKVKLLAKTQMEPVDLYKVDIQPFVRDIVRTLRDEYEDREIDVQIIKEGTSMIMKCDELIGGLLYNIMENSIQHDINDRVRIDIQYEEYNLEGRDGVLLSFSDRGPGIPNQIKNKVFSRKERKEDVRPGRGLGLVIINSIVERYGGKIWIEDRVVGDSARGVKFSVFIPSE